MDQLCARSRRVASPRCSTVRSSSAWHQMRNGLKLQAPHQTVKDLELWVSVDNYNCFAELLKYKNEEKKTKKIGLVRDLNPGPLAP